jgi:hypothetical protein
VDWYVIRHPETGGVGVVADSALDIYKGLGWIRVSDAVGESAKDQIVTQDYAEAVDLDAPSTSSNKVFIKESA